MKFRYLKLKCALIFLLKKKNYFFGPEARFAKIQAESNIAKKSSVKPDNSKERPAVATISNKPRVKANTIALKTPFNVRKLKT